VILSGFFSLTAFLSRMYHKEIHVLADDMFAQGQANLKAGNPQEAVENLRNALKFVPGNEKFQMLLAQALAASGQYREARNYLETLLSGFPGSGDINLELARIAVHEGKVAEAERYYHSAIYGVWENDPIAMRWMVRQELCDFLLAHGDLLQARPEIMALGENTPSNEIPHLKIAGSLLLRAGMWSGALKAFQAVLEADKNDVDALRGAGISAFELGHFGDSQRYLTRLPKEQLSSPEVQAKLSVSEGILGADPFLPGLSTAQKAARASRAFELAESNAKACKSKFSGASAGSPTQAKLQQALGQAQASEAEWSERELERHPDRVDAAMKVAFELEDAASAACGEPQGDDHINWLLGQSRKEAVP
jgi:predicted Zn-dependent protease